MSSCTAGMPSSFAPSSCSAVSAATISFALPAIVRSRDQSAGPSSSSTIASAPADEVICTASVKRSRNCSVKRNACMSWPPEGCAESLLNRRCRAGRTSRCMACQRFSVIVMPSSPRGACRFHVRPRRNALLIGADQPQRACQSPFQPYIREYPSLWQRQSRHDGEEGFRVQDAGSGCRRRDLGSRTKEAGFRVQDRNSINPEPGTLNPKTFS